MSDWRTTPDVTSELERIRGESLEIACPACPALPGEVCRNTSTGQALGKAPAHWARLKGVVL